MRLSKLFNLSKQTATIKGRRSVRQQRNICIVLGVLAEKLSGPSSVAILTPGTLAYLITNLVRTYYNFCNCFMLFYYINI